MNRRYVVFSDPPDKCLPTTFQFAQPLSATEQSTPHALCCIAQNPTLNTIDPQQPLQTSRAKRFSVLLSEAAKTGNRCIVSHCCCSSFLFAARLIATYCLTFCLVMNYPHPCKSRAECIDNSSHAYFIGS